MLSFLSPLFLLGAATAAIPIVLHLLKREPEARVKFPAVALLKKGPVEHTEKRRIREWLLLAMRVATLILLAVAFARPFLASGVAVGSAGITMIALDTSASLSAPDAFERAKQLAQDAVDRVPSGQLIGVMTFADVPILVAPPSVDRAFARAAIDAATPGFGAARYQGALGAAVQAFGDRRGTIIVVTDLQENGLDAGAAASVPEFTSIEIADVGPMPPNLAVAEVRSVGERIIASVFNSDAAAREARVRLTLDDRSQRDAKVTVAAHASAEVEFDEASRATTAAVAVEDATGIQADNVRYAVLGGANRPTVLVVTATGDLGREAFYVQQALLAGATNRNSYQVRGVGAAQLSTWDSSRFVPAVAAFLLSTRGLERRGREALATYVRSGGGMVIAAGPELDSEVVADVFGGDTRLRISVSESQDRDQRTPELSFAVSDARHPVFQVFGSEMSPFGQVRFHRAASIEGPECQAIGRFTTGAPALLECTVGDGRALVLASDLDGRWNNLPLHVAFVPFLSESVRYLGGKRAPVGEFLVGEAPAGLAATPGVATVASTSGVGASGSRRIAINVDPRESNPARISVEEFQAAVTRRKDADRAEGRVGAWDEDRQHVWQYVLCLMIGLLVVEGFVARRTA
jgi:Aerotolerance regulator N-terminal/von Willebrand factor type A domain